MKALENLIKKIAQEKNIAEEQLTNELIELLKLKYDVTLMEKERTIIDEVRNKIITRLYNTDNHSIDTYKFDVSKHFKLDKLEQDYLERAQSELVQEGLLETDKHNMALTKTGILKYKEFYGEI